MTEAVIEAARGIGDGEGPARARESSTPGFARHVVQFSLANVGALVSNGVLTFLLPRLLSMESYGYYRLFLLYGGFAGVLHLGLLDGALIRWAANPERRIREEVLGSLTFLLAEHAAVLMPAVAVLAILFHGRPWFFLGAALALYAVVYNVATLGQFALQAEKSFALLSWVTVLNPALLLASVVGLHYAGRLTLGTLVGAYITAWVLASVPVWMWLGGGFSRRKGGARRAWRIGQHNVRIGWSVLVALLLTNLALALDRIVVSVGFGIRDFAVYSLAATALAVVNTIILAVSRVVFPYLSNGISRERQVQAYWAGEACLVALWAVSLAGYFPLHWLIAWLLPGYVASLPVLRLLMLGTGLTGIIQILQSNYFRSSLRLGQLLLGCVAGLLSALALLMLARRSGQLWMMALAMFAALAVWWMLNERLLASVTGGGARNLLRTVVVYGGCAGWFVWCSSWSSLAAGAGAYFGAALLTLALAYRSLLSTNSELLLGRAHRHIVLDATD